MLTGTWYIGGPMTEIPHRNFPAFYAAAEELRQNYPDATFISPAELDDPETRDAAMSEEEGGVYDTPSAMSNGQTWADFLARDVKLLGENDVDGMLVLDGWQKSRGARLETFIVAGLRGKPVLKYPTLQPIHWVTLMLAWVGPLINHPAGHARTK